MEKNKRPFSPKRALEWLIYARIYQSKKIFRDGRKFARKICNIFKSNIEMNLKRFGFE